MWKFFQANKNGIPLDICQGLRDAPTPIVESAKTVSAHWKSVSPTTATTTVVAEPPPNESLLLTDLIVILSKKVASATIIIRFADGTNTENLFTFDAATDSFQFEHAFQGGMKAWKDAALQVVTDQATTVTVFAGYLYISPVGTDTYSVWNSKR